MLQGKKAIVTGGTRGIGLAIVKAFLRNGADVAVCGSRKETAEKAVEELKKEFPERRIIPLFPNLTEKESVACAFAEAEKALGGLDILVNNAGLSARESFYDYDYEAYKKVMGLNLDAVFLCSQAAAKFMKANGAE